MDALAQFGLGGGDLAPQIESVTYPKPTQGRVAHIDADFLAYMVSAESKDELDGTLPRKSFEEMQHNAREAVKHLTAMAGATDYRCHLTPSASTKGNRPAQAVQQEYQANRHDREKPEFLDAIRAFIASELQGIPHLDQEADDGLAQANYNAQGPRGAWGDSSLSIIVSKDKDLRMVPGLHMDWETGEHFTVGDAFGSVWLDDSKSTKKLVGWGTKFFWAQCLMGDPADFIKGLPEVAGSIHCGLKPTVAYKTALAKVKAGAEGSKLDSAKRVVAAAEARTKKVGPAMAYDMLKDVRNDMDAFQVVKTAWTALATEHDYQFTHWRTGAAVTPTQALLGDMQLLWMRRNKNPLDVVDWIKEFAA